MSEKLAPRPLAILIQGNPRFLRDPRVAALAEALRARLASLLATQGYAVEMDPGEPYTQPRDGAVLWIGHSRGVDRLRFAPAGVATLALAMLSDDGLDPDHYSLSPADLAAVANLVPNPSTRASAPAPRS